MDIRSIEQRVFHVVAEQFAISENYITSETRFVEDLGADSLDTIQMGMDLEEEFSEKGFDFGIPEEDSKNLKTAGQVVDYVRERLQNPSVATKAVGELMEQMEHRPNA